MFQQKEEEEVKKQCLIRRGSLVSYYWPLVRIRVEIGRAHV